MEKAVECSVRGLKDEFESYVAGVLDVAVIPEIETAIANKWALVIHCNSGMHRAPSGLLAWLLKRIISSRLSFTAALDLVRNCRSPAFRGDFAGQTPKNNFLNHLEARYRYDATAVVYGRTSRSRTATNDGRHRHMVKPPEKGVEDWTGFSEHVVTGSGRFIVQAGVASPTAVATDALDCALDCSFMCGQSQPIHVRRKRWSFALINSIFKVSIKTIRTALTREVPLEALYAEVADGMKGVFCVLMAAVASEVRSPLFKAFADGKVFACVCSMEDFMALTEQEAISCDWLFASAQRSELA